MTAAGDVREERAAPALTRSDWHRALVEARGLAEQVRDDVNSTREAVRLARMVLQLSEGGR